MMLSFAQIVSHASLDIPVTSVPLTYKRQRIGYLSREIANRCQSAPQVFRCAPDVVELTRGQQQDVEHRVAELLKSWHAQGVFKRWRGERIDALHPATGAPLFALEREGRVVLGLTMAGVHLNAFTRKAGALHLWVAQRALTKSVHPGMWDNAADGGVGAGESAAYALEREADEEAGIPAHLTQGAIAYGALRITHHDADFYFYERACIFDLELPSDFTPKNNDGEVAQFACLDVLTLKHWLAQEKFTVDAALTILDWLHRHDAALPAPVVAALNDLRC